MVGVAFDPRPRAAALAIAAMLCVATAACGGKREGTSDTDGSSATTSALDGTRGVSSGMVDGTSTSTSTSGHGTRSSGSSGSSSGTDTSGISPLCAMTFSLGVSCGTIEDTDENGCGDTGGIGTGSTSTSGGGPCDAIEQSNAEVHACIAQAKRNEAAYSYTHHYFRNIGQYDITTQYRVKEDGLTWRLEVGWEDLCYLDRLAIYANYGATQLEICYDDGMCKVH